MLLFKLSNCGRNELLDHTEGTLLRTCNKAQGSVHSFPKDGSNDSRLFAGVPTGRRNHSQSGACEAQRPSIMEAGVTAVRRTHKEWASALGLQLPSSLVYACLMSALYALGVKLLMWAITVILCLDKSSCMQLGVWVIIISAHYVWLAAINERKKREKVIGQMSLFTRAWNQKENLHRLRTNECERKTFASQRGSVPSLFVDPVGLNCPETLFSLKAFQAFKWKPAAWQYLFNLSWKVCGLRRAREEF